MPFCPRCGRENPLDVTVCYNCGYPIGARLKAQAEKEAEFKTIPQGRSPVSAAKSRNREWSLAVAGAAILVVLLFIFGPFAYGPSPPAAPRLYLHNADVCSMPATGALQGSVECGGKVLASCPPTCPEQDFFIKDNFAVLGAPRTFSIQFAANGPLWVSLSGKVIIFNFLNIFTYNQAVLKLATYHLAPGNYTLDIVNQNHYQLIFNITAYLD